MSNLLSLLSTEVAAFASAADKREYLIARAEKIFDDTVAKIDLPGPDQVIDPLLRSVVRPIVGKLYDDVIKQLEANIHA